MNRGEASKVVKAALARGPQGAPPPAPSSLADAIDLVVGDRVESFGDVLVYLEGQVGPEPRALRAFTLVSWAELEKLASRIVGEVTRRRAADLRRWDQRVAEGAPMDDAARERRRLLEQDVKDGVRLEVALDILSAAHLREGEELAQEVVSQEAKERLAPVALAQAKAVKPDWPEFDGALRRVEREVPIPGAVEYLRAVEQQDRYVRPDKARELLEQTTAVAPKYIRAKARLALAQDDVESTHARMEALCSEAPRHPVCVLARGYVERALAAQRSSSRGTP